MKTFLTCVPCLVRQTVDFMRHTGVDRERQEQLLKDVLRMMSEMDLETSPPLMTQAIHRFIREETGTEDPYRAKKDYFNQLAMGLYPQLKSQVQTSIDPFQTGIKLAIAGNVIDLGANSHLSEVDINAVLDETLDIPLSGDVTAFRDTVHEAASILYLTDNAGEIVFDRLLIEQMPLDRVTAVVRGRPILNDATLSDAQATGLTELVRVIDNGSDAPGTVLDDCSQEFRDYFAQSGLVIAKGQGNYETLSEVEKDIFFLLKAKCPVVARDLSCDLGDLVLYRSTFKPRSAESSGALVATTAH